MVFYKDIQIRHGLENIASVVIENETGNILAMVGSRDFFDKEIDGEFNVALSKRQPGSSFKPFVYATSFEKGFLPETVVFDVQTQFSSYCEKDNFETTKECYSPVNYRGGFFWSSFIFYNNRRNVFQTVSNLNVFRRFF